MASLFSFILLYIIKMSWNHAKAYAKEYGKAVVWWIDDALEYMIPEVIKDPANAAGRKIAKMSNWKYSYPSKEDTDKRNNEARENVRKWFKMMKNWANKAAEKVWEAAKKAVWAWKWASVTYHKLAKRATLKK